MLQQISIYNGPCEEGLRSNLPFSICISSTNQKQKKQKEKEMRNGFWVIFIDIYLYIYIYFTSDGKVGIERLSRSNIFTRLILAESSQLKLLDRFSKRRPTLIYEGVRLFGLIRQTKLRNRE